MTKEEREENNADREALMRGVDRYKEQIAEAIADYTEEDMSKVKHKKRNKFLKALGL